MKQVSLGNSGTEVSAMCLGTMYFGSRVEEQRAFALMDAYFEHGGRFLDTSNNYVFWVDGFTGDESETTVGKWLRTRSNRDDIFLATKCGVRPTGKDSQGNFIFEGLSKAAIENAVVGSLKRLGVDAIDLYYIHVDWRRETLEETLQTLNTLVTSGMVKHIACSNMSTWRLVKAKDISRREGWAEFVGIQNWFSYLQPRHHADLWVQKFVDDELFDYCQTEKDVTILPYTSTLGGLYAWDSIYDKNHPALNNRFFSEDNERRLHVIKDIAKVRGVTPFRVMFAWMLSRKVSMVPILGVSQLSQLEDNLGALDLILTDAEIARLDEAAFNGKPYKELGEVKLF
jgi:aryl-alcohol dehydrogenase-like predicted oxidoreductase